MVSRSRSLLLAASLMAVPLATAMAQQNNPPGNMGSNRSVTATPGTADSHAASGTDTGDVARHNTGASNYGGSAAANPTTAGGTGRTVVPGSTSSQASSSAGTDATQTGGTSGGGK